MNNLKLNHLAIWICIIGMHGFGFVWYGPLFGETWMKLVEMDPATMQADSMQVAPWIMNSTAIIASIYVLAWVLMSMNVTTGIRGAGVALIITAGIHLLPVMNANMFAQEPYGLAWITGGYGVAGLTISGYILGAWIKRKE